MNRHPPSGTVIFLFTDIQGSTQLWQLHPQTMPRALERHHDILRHAILQNNGYVFQIIGDAFCAAFYTVLEAVNAALTAQRLLNSEDWGEIGLILVRMAIHSGTAQVQVGEYTSGEYSSNLTLSRAARLLSAGHGGQVLISQTTRELLTYDLPEDVSLIDLGQHRLKDLKELEHIYQLCLSDLPTEFPPIKSLDTYPNNLPVQLTSFIGRECELDEIRNYLVHDQSTPNALGLHPKLLTLTGAGGSGKTRLALQAAWEVLEDFNDGVWFLELAPLLNPDAILQSLADLLRVREVPWQPLWDTLINYLIGKQLLLILDNCEHLVEGCAKIAEQLLQNIPGFKILATSREALNVTGEINYPVPPLALPQDADLILGIHHLGESEVVRLFTERAKAVVPSFAVTEQNARPIVQICNQLDGIPLAIELAAARVKLLSVEQIAARLADRFRLLTGGSRTILERQQTLKASIDWSYQLLSEKERSLFTRLAVFVGGWTLEAAETVCSDPEESPSNPSIGSDEVLDLLADLVNKSLVTVERAGAEVRYRLLETIRQYAAERLLDSGETQMLHNRHLTYYASKVVGAGTSLRTDRQDEFFKWLSFHNDNLQAAMDWAESARNVEAALLLTSTMWWYWYRRDHLIEGVTRLEKTLALPDPMRYPLLLARVLLALGNFAWLQGDYIRSKNYLEQSILLARNLGEEGKEDLALILPFCLFTEMRLGNQEKAELLGKEGLIVARQMDNLWCQALANFGLGRLAIESGDHKVASVHCREACELFTQVADDHWLAISMNNLVLLAERAGNYSEAIKISQQSLALFRQEDNKWGIANCLASLGNLARQLGDLDKAREFFLECLKYANELGTTGDIARSLHNLGFIALHQGDLESADKHLHEALNLFRQIKLERGVAECLTGFAALAAACGQPVKAAQLLAVADQMFASLGTQRWPIDQKEYDELVGDVQRRLGQDAFREAYQQSSQTSLEQAIEIFISQ